MKNLKNWNKFIVYRHITPNGFSYIGITSVDPEKCWKNGKGYYGTLFEEMILKYGWENIEHEILFTGLTEAEARLVKYLTIESYSSYIGYDDCAGYNCTLGNLDLLISRCTRKSIHKICKMFDIY